MKKKFLIFTLCFTIIFSSLNINKSYADGGVISLPMLAVVSSLAVGTGIVINNNNSLYDLGNLFYSWVDKHNSLTWETVTLAFSTATSIVNNKILVNGNFLDIVKEFFDTSFTGESVPVELDSSTGLKVYTTTSNDIFANYKSYKGLPTFKATPGTSHSISKVTINIGTGGSTTNSVLVYLGDTLISDIANLLINKTYGVCIQKTNGKYYLVFAQIDDKGNIITGTFPYLRNVITSPVFGNGYTWDNVESKREEDNSVVLPIPGDLGSLVGQGSLDFWDNTDNLVGSSDISIPTVQNPSISLDNTTSFPNTNVDTDNPSIPDVDSPTIDGIFPAFPSFGDSLDFSPMYLTNVTEKFPFSLPWDIGRLIQKFDVEPVNPIFEVPIVSETITLDLTEFSELASIVRFFVLVGFILALVFISTKLMA